MGSCISVHKDPQSAPKLRLSAGSKNDKLLISSPVKRDSGLVDDAVSDVALKPQWSPRFSGSKEEIFFDSQPWMDSDCEDDFFSVKGDFTPSRGSTPVHHSFSSGRLQVNKPPVVGEPIGGAIPPDPSSSDKIKRLSELFEEESLRVVAVDEENKAVAAEVEAINSVPLPKSANGTPSERTPNGFLKKKTEGNSVKSAAQCCLPRLISSRSFSERKKRTVSPARSVG